MTRSRSRAKASKGWFILLALLLLTGVANAGRKRVVVLEFEGDKAERFHADVIKLIKKSHTVVSVDKWNGTAEEMSAARMTDRNIKKVAKKLKVDGVVSGTVEKRRSEYILRLKLRSGSSGELVGSQINIKSGSAKLDSTAARDVKDELIEIIADLDSNRGGRGGGDDDEEDARPTKIKKPVEDEDEDEDEKPKRGFVKKPADDEEKKPKKTAKKPAAAEDDEDEDEAPPKKAAKKPAKKAAKKPAADEEKKPKKVAKKPADDEDDDEDEDEKPTKKVASKDDDDDDDGGDLDDRAEPSSMDAATRYSPGERAVDAVVGMSFTARRMAFSYDRDATVGTPAGYSQLAPVPGAYVDATVYPLAIGHSRKDLLRGLGVTVMFDRVLALNSRNPNDGMKLKSTAQRFAAGAVFRYPLGEGAGAPVVGAALRYNQQQFTIAGEAAIPDVTYSMVDFAGFFLYSLGPKMVLNLDAGALLLLDAGEITKIKEYGRAKITGLEAKLGLDYHLTPSIFARGELRVETLGYAFKNEGDRSMGVGGARDTYFGGALTAGFLY